MSVLQIDPKLCRMFVFPTSKDESYNERRLLLRRQLEDVVNTAWADYKKTYTWRSSLSHPHAFNRFSVSSLRVNLGRAKKDVAKLKSFLGREFSDVVSSPVRTIHLFARVDEHGLSCGLTIPAESWWDFAKLTTELEEGGDDVLNLLKKHAPSGVIEAQHWIQPEEIELLDPQQWMCVLRSHKPGESFFTVKFHNGFEEDVEDFLNFHISNLDKIFHALKWDM